MKQNPAKAESVCSPRYPPSSREDKRYDHVRVATEFSGNVTALEFRPNRSRRVRSAPELASTRTV